MNPWGPVAAGVAATLAFGAVWHGPLGAGERFATRVEKIARATMTHLEAPPLVTARLQRGPLTRSMTLAGPADSFQRSELLRIMSQVPGVGEVHWDPASLPQEGNAQ